MWHIFYMMSITSYILHCCMMNTSSHLDKSFSISPMECNHHSLQNLQRNHQCQDGLSTVVHRLYSTNT